MSRAWMPLYIADYLADTTHLSNAAIGSYLLLIMHYWQHGFLPDDDSTLRRIARCESRWWPRMKDDLKPFFYDEWKHKRIDQELEKSNSFSSQQSEKANKRWSRGMSPVFPKAYPNGHAEDMPRARASQSQSHIKDSLNGLEGQKIETAELVFIKEETEQWNAWTEFYRSSKRHSPSAISRKGTNERGWYFPTEWPPSKLRGALPEH